MAADRFTCTPGRVAAWYGNCAMYVAVNTVVLGKFQAVCVSMITSYKVRRGYSDSGVIPTICISTAIFLPKQGSAEL